MKKIILIVVLAGALILSNKTWAGSNDIFVFSDKNKTTAQAESWSNKVGPVELGGYFKVNFPKNEMRRNYWGEAFIDYVPLKIGPAKFGICGNAEIKTGYEILYRAYLVGKAGPFTLRYAPVQSDDDQKIELSWFWEKNKIQLFGYIDHNIIRHQKALNVAECYIGYRVIKNAVVFAGIKPIWFQGKKIEIDPGVGIKFEF